MSILFQLLSSDNKSLAQTTWNLVARLPLYEEFPEEVDFEKEYLVRYWLYAVDDKKQYEKITKQLLKKVSVQDKLPNSYLFLHLAFFG